MSLPSFSVSLLAVVLAYSLSGRQLKPAAASAAATDVSGTAAEVLAFEKIMEAAVVRGDVKFLDQICAPDFSLTHGDGWVNGGQPLRVENKAQWLASVGKQPYLSRDLGSVRVELHGDIAITYGMYHARNRTPADSKQAEFPVW